MTIGTCAPELLSLKAIVVLQSVFCRFNKWTSRMNGAVSIGFGLKPATQKGGLR